MLFLKRVGVVFSLKLEPVGLWLVNVKRCESMDRRLCVSVS